MISGSIYTLPAGEFFLTSGSALNHVNPIIVPRGMEIESLWERMYVNPQPVVLACAYCKCHNACTNSTCIECGAPMGYAQQRVFA